MRALDQYRTAPSSYARGQRVRPPALPKPGKNGATRQIDQANAIICRGAFWPGDDAKMFVKIGWPGWRQLWASASAALIHPQFIEAALILIPVRYSAATGVTPV